MVSAVSAFLEGNSAVLPCGHDAVWYGGEYVVGSMSGCGLTRRVDNGVRGDIFNSALKRWRLLLVAS